MPGPKKENYTRCEVCTKAAGYEVVYPNYALTSEEADMFDDTKRIMCPKGHTIKEEAPS